MKKLNKVDVAVHLMRNSVYGKPNTDAYEKPWVIGCLYKPCDNSYCKNIFTEEHACIVQQDIAFPDFDYVGPDKAEDGAEFTIVKQPHHVLICDDEYRVFVHVKSSLTGNVYRTLYREQ